MGRPDHRSISGMCCPPLSSLSALGLKDAEGWDSVVRVITVDNGRNSQEAMDTMTVGIEKKKVFRMVTVA